jgi:tRNA pseudouridine38-40 synthase
VRLRLDLAYEGTAFAGWASQPGQRTVQGVLEDALHVLFRQPIRLTVAGRTDAGVHATGQVAHCDVPAARWPQLAGIASPRLAGLLPPDLRVRAVTTPGADFDARFAALWRRYEYRLCDASAGPSPLRRRFVAASRRRLDDRAMAQAAHGLVGLHDFAAFCRARPNATTVRTLQQLVIAREGDEVVGTVRADAFCHSMVRSLVGALVAVGEGRRPVGWPAELLARERRADEVTVAPAHGLTLVEVGYPPRAQYGARVATTRATRDVEEAR